MSAATPRILPIRLPPEPGEPLDSWVAAYAARLGTPILDLAAGLGPGRSFWRQPAADVALGKGVGALVGLAAAAGLTDEQVKAMWRPLARYRHLVRARFASSRLRWMVLPLRWSRFCPACLADTGGRWRTRWRLPWQLACPTHATLLCSRCPRCDGRQRQEALLQDIDTAQTMTCDVPTPTASGRGDHRCGNDLRSTTAEPTGLWRLLDFQEQLAPLLHPSTADAAMTVLMEDLADVLTVAGQRDLTPGSTTSQGLCDTATLADAVERANETLRGGDQDQLRELALADMRGRPQPLPRLWRTASTTLAGRVLVTRDSHLRSTDRLRWRTTTTGARPTITGDDSRLGCVPTALWSEWVVRLQPPGDYNPITFSKVAAAALLLPGATRSFAAVLSNWTSDTALSRASATVLRKLAATEHGDTVLRALTQLSDGLLAHGSPIDYQLRRHLAATTALMDAADWDRICAQAGMATGGARKLRWARLWIWETVTAGLLEHAPDGVRPSDSEQMASYHRFPLPCPRSQQNSSTLTPADCSTPQAAGMSRPRGPRLPIGSPSPVCPDATPAASPPSRSKRSCASGCLRERSPIGWASPASTSGSSSVNTRPISGCDRPAGGRRCGTPFPPSSPPNDSVSSSSTTDEACAPSGPGPASASTPSGALCNATASRPRHRAGFGPRSTRGGSAPNISMSVGPFPTSRPSSA